MVSDIAFKSFLQDLLAYTKVESESMFQALGKSVRQI